MASVAARPIRIFGLGQAARVRPSRSGNSGKALARCRARTHNRDPTLTQSNSHPTKSSDEANPVTSSKPLNTRAFEVLATQAALAAFDALPKNYGKVLKTELRRILAQ
jgi:hypothetical protein